MVLRQIFKYDVKPAVRRVADAISRSRAKRAARRSVIARLRRRRRIGAGRGVGRVIKARPRRLRLQKRRSPPANYFS